MLHMHGKDDSLLLQNYAFISLKIPDKLLKFSTDEYSYTKRSFISLCIVTRNLTNTMFSLTRSTQLIVYHLTQSVFHNITLLPKIELLVNSHNLWYSSLLQTWKHSCEENVLLMLSVWSLKRTNQPGLPRKICWKIFEYTLICFLKQLSNTNSHVKY